MPLVVSWPLYSHPQAEPLPPDVVGLVLGCAAVYLLFFLSVAISRRWRPPAPDCSQQRGAGADAVQRTPAAGCQASQELAKWRREVGLDDETGGVAHLNGLVANGDRLASICKQLTADKALHTLDLGCNSIGTSGARQLYSALRSNCALRSLR